MILTTPLSAQPVRVVCVADAPVAFARDPVLRERLVLPVGRRYAVALGSGFVVDPARRHVVSSWHAVTTCTGDASARRQVAVLEAGDAAPVLAERLPDRNFQDALGNAVKLVQALCRDQHQPCGADLPRSPDDKPLAEGARRRQLDNLLAYAPDLAVLRLRDPLQARPLALALQQQLDDRMRLLIRGFALPTADTTDATLTAAADINASYTGPQQVSHRPPGGQPQDEIHAKLHRLAASVGPAQAGAAVLRGAGVVGVLSALQDLPGSRSAGNEGTAYAVPVTVVAVFLDLLKVPYVVAAPALTVRTPALLDAAPGPAATPWWSDARALMLVGALALALLAGAAFLLLAQRNRRAGTAPPLWPQRTITRVNPTLLHAVAMPTEAMAVADTPPPAETVLAPVQVLGTAPVAVQLRCSEGPLADAVFSLPMPNGGTTLFVGRDTRSCQIVLPATMDRVSAVHACFAWDAPQRRLTLRDLSSSGTWVNGQRIAKARTLALTGGDEVDLGGLGLNRFTIDIPADPQQHITEILP